MKEAGDALGRLNEWRPVIDVLAIGALGLHNWWIGRRNTKKTEDIKTTVVEAKQEMHTDFAVIKTLMNGEKLDLYRQRADALTLVAAYRNQPGDVERADQASLAYNALQVEQALLMGHAIQAEIDMRKYKP